MSSSSEDFCHLNDPREERVIPDTLVGNAWGGGRNM
jgi:hypothetical protein